MRKAVFAFAAAASLALAGPLHAETVVESAAAAPVATPDTSVSASATPASAQPATPTVLQGTDGKVPEVGAQSALIPAVAAPVSAVPEPAVIPPLVVARINLSKQRMEVVVDGQLRHSWPVSTARKGYRTPVGTYKPQRMHRRYFSRKYDNAPMPYSIFFHRGWAIHGTTDLKRLGRPASHGCVRLHPGNAATLFALVKEYGSGNTRIVVTR